MTEQDIITGCQEGVPRCQRELVDRYAPMLLTVARRYARDQATAQDILQDALLRIFQAIPRYQPPGLSLLFFHPYDSLRRLVKYLVFCPP